MKAPSVQCCIYFCYRRLRESWIKLGQFGTNWNSFGRLRWQMAPHTHKRARARAQPCTRTFAHAHSKTHRSGQTCRYLDTTGLPALRCATHNASRRPHIELSTGLILLLLTLSETFFKDNFHRLCSLISRRIEKILVGYTLNALVQFNRWWQSWKVA